MCCSLMQRSRVPSGVGPGEYQLTPPAFAPAGFTQTAHVAPFVLQSASQFRPSAPPALTSPQYAEDFAEVHSLGELNSTARTADQTAVGKFWGAGPVWVVWNQVADQAGIGFGNGLEQNARMFALLDTTLAGCRSPTRRTTRATLERTPRSVRPPRPFSRTSSALTCSRSPSRTAPSASRERSAASRRPRTRLRRGGSSPASTSATTRMPDRHSVAKSRT